MQAVIFAGGLGTRLRPFTITVPKPLLPLGETPIIQILLRQLHEQGFRRVDICLGYMSRMFQFFIGDGSAFGLQINYVVEDAPLGTAGALLTIADLDENFIVLNGDTLTDLSFRNLIDFHVSKSAYGTIFAAKVDESVDYGIVEFDSGSHVLTGYLEKPKRHYYVSTGVYALSKKILEFARPEKGGRLDMPDLLRAATMNGRSVLCYIQDDAYWRDIGRFDHYEAAAKDYQVNPERFLNKLADQQKTK